MKITKILLLTTTGLLTLASTTLLFSSIVSVKNSNNSISNTSSNLGRQNNGIGLVSANEDNITSQQLNNIDWDNNFYKNYDGGVSSNYDISSLENFPIQLTNVNGIDKNDAALNLPSTGSSMYNEQAYGINILNTKVLYNEVDGSTYGISGGIIDNSSDYSNLVDDFASTSPTRSITNFGLDFGYMLNLDTFVDAGNTFTTNYFNDASGFLNDDFYGQDSGNDNFTDSSYDGDYAPISNLPSDDFSSKVNGYNFAVDGLYRYNLSNRSVSNEIENNPNFSSVPALPYAAFNVTTNLGESDQKSYQLGSFGMEISNSNGESKFLTFIIENQRFTQNSSASNSASFDQEHLIIDRNNDENDMEAEIGDVGNLNNSDNTTILNTIDSINGQSAAPDDWGLQARRSTSLIRDNSLNSGDNSFTVNSQLPTYLNWAEKRTKNPYPPRYLNQGYNPKVIINQAFSQQWNSSDINSRADQNNFYAFRSHFKMNRGFYRDLAANTNPTYYFPSKGTIYDEGNLFTTIIRYNARYNNNIWNESGNPNTNQNFFNVNLNNDESSFYGWGIETNQTSPADQFNNLNVFFRNNENLSGGAIAGVVVSGFFISMTPLIGIYFYRQKRKNKKHNLI